MRPPRTGDALVRGQWENPASHRLGRSRTTGRGSANPRLPAIGAIPGLEARDPDGADSESGSDPGPGDAGRPADILGGRSHRRPGSRAVGSLRPSEIDRSGPRPATRSASSSRLQRARLRGLLRRRLRARPADRPCGPRTSTSRPSPTRDRSSRLFRRTGASSAAASDSCTSTTARPASSRRRPSAASPGGSSELERDLLITEDNEYGTAAEDARRRDFTVNGLFLDPDRANVILDFGRRPGAIWMRRTLRTIGDPAVRLAEDPVRHHARDQVRDAPRLPHRAGHLDGDVCMHRPPAAARSAAATGARGDPAPAALRGRAWEPSACCAHVGALHVLLPDHWIEFTGTLATRRMRQTLERAERFWQAARGPRHARSTRGFGAQRSPVALAASLPAGGHRGRVPARPAVRRVAIRSISRWT